MEVVDPRRMPLVKQDLAALVRDIDYISATKGRQVVRLDLCRKGPKPVLLAQILLGPTGKLRAPMLRIRKTLLVGFDEAMYCEVFGR